MSKIKQFFRQSGLTKAQLLAGVLCYFLCFALFLGIVVIWNPLSLSSTPTEDSQAADGPTNTSGYWTDSGRYDISWYNNPDTETYGDGSESNPYIIDSAEDLAGLSWLVYTKGQEGNPLDYSGAYTFQGKYFKQTANIDLSLYYWQPIGISYTRDGTSRQNYFSGSYDGGNHTVSGIFTPAGSSNAYSYQGLFGFVYSSSSTYPITIQNIGINNSLIQGNQSVGGVVGYAPSSGTITITNCYNTGSVSGSSYVGGVVGDAPSSSGAITITNCYNTGSVSGSGGRVGGVVGGAHVVSSGAITITNCYNTGSVSGSSTRVGGVVGSADASSSSSSSSGTITITNCYNTGSVESTDSSVGGVVGSADVSSSSSSTITITNCYNTGSVESTGSYVGGVVGYTYSGAIITNCYYGANCSSAVGGINGADRTGQAEYSTTLTANSPKTLSWYTTSSNWDSTYPWDFEEIWTLDQGRNGGYPSFIITYWISDPSYYSIEWFNNPDAETYGDGSESNPYIIDSAEDLAGLSWLVYTKGEAGNPLIENTDYSGGYIFQGKFFKQTANIDLSTYYWQPIGIYYTREGTTRQNFFVHSSSSSYPVTIKNIGITNSYIQGYQNVGGVVGEAGYNTTITNCYNTGAVTGSSRVGGVVGEALKTTITNCYNTGNVTSTATSFSYVGGVVGMTSGNITITNCYNTGSVNGSSSVGGVVGEAFGSGATITITNCYNTGNVTSTETSYSQVGGVVGRSAGTTINNCYNTGTVTGSGSGIGGVVGGTSSSGTITITNCYNTGNVTSTATSSSYVGGVVGRNSNATITNCYYGGNCPSDVGGINGDDVPGQAEYDANLTNETPKTLSWYTTESNWNSTYPWDFENVWQIDPNVNDGYPSFIPPPIDWWTNEDNYSIEWYTSTDTTTYGDGTAENPYKISTAADLAGLSYLVYSNAVEAADSTQSQSGSEYYIFSNAYFEQTANIDLSAHVWQPIGIHYDRTGTPTQHYFSGNYDGGGYTVSGINTPAGDTFAYSYQGLFGYVYSSSSSYPVTIQNIGITNSFIQGYQNVGGVVGYASSSGTITITNCYNTGSVESTGLHIGGVVGYAHSTTITNCYNAGSVSGSGDYVGGVVGYTYGYSSGDTTPISNCYNTGNVTSTATSSSNVGGVAGAASNTNISKCYNTGSISGGDRVGGITGHYFDGGCTNMRAVFNRGNVTGAEYVGGISGSGGGKILQAYNTGIVSGTDYVGGISYEDASSSGGVEIVAAFNIGQVVSSGTNVDPTASKHGSSCLLYYGGPLVQQNAEANGTYVADLDTQAKTLTFLRDTLGFDFGSMWQLDAENVNDGYPIFGLDSGTWIGSGNYSTTLLGEGTEQDPYQIWSAADLAGLAYVVQSGELNGETLTPVVDEAMGISVYLSGVYFEQKADIDLSAHYWEPIGSMAGMFNGDPNQMAGFGGIFDGGNFKISGLYTLKTPDLDVGEGVTIGLFGMVAGEQTAAEKTAQIKNVHLTDADLSVQMFGGAIAGVALNARIENCSAAGKYSAIIHGSGATNGGMVGMAMMSEIDNCINYCEQTVLMNSASYYGGIVGMSQMSTITNCKNFGDSITVAGGYIGGIVGQSPSQDTISNCENYADFVQIEAFSSISTLGFAGIVPEASAANISGCLNYGTIAASLVPSSGATLAGIVATAEGNTTIANCANFGLIDGSASEMVAPAGIVGSLTASQITNSSNFGPVNGMMSAGVALTISGNCSITGCNNYGTITGDMLASGILGAAMTDGVNITISDCGSFGRLNGSMYVAGILGLYDNRIIVDVVVTNCAVDITVSATSSNIMVGGIFGVISQTSGGVGHVVLSADKCSVNVNIFSDQTLTQLNDRVFDAETRFGDPEDVYTLTYTNSYGTVSVNGAIEARALTEDTSAMEGNFVYLTGLNDGRPLPIKTDGSYFFHQHTFGTTTGILDQINEVFYPNLAAQPITFETTYWDFSESEAPPFEQIVSQNLTLGLSAGKTYNIEMTIDGTSVSTTTTASWQDSAAAPSSAISFGDGLNLTVNGVSYFFMIVENATLNDAGAFIYTPGQTILFAYGYTNNTGEGATITPSVPVVITAIREVA